MLLGPSNIDVAIAVVTDMAVVIVAVVPDADADATVEHSAIDLDDSAVAAGSPAAENPGVAPALPFPDFGLNYCCNLANHAVDQH